ncbi:DUF4365 domain-containing protein [Leptolyngbya sp. NIES-2104]|uniref:DUF4365 domain-containing protein n=1 Tax=Leptolyngbya sp. NIES-2104 TaxID=1552121 RepID=UPI0006EC8352|nr:DUF4365 domain-containing protein [Leptolyngbya sp. NIES-2104]GAP95150.1 hypothetical protein NIES2104_16700 [Leptolyngbya sp. NIES-2104]
MVKKRRTRQHIIADLSANHVERIILQCGYSVERIVNDYGTDLIISTYNIEGEIENGFIYIQLKATDTINLLSDQETISFTVKRSDLELWLQEPMPYILILYSAQQDIAYWLYLQAYFQQQDIELTGIGTTYTVHFKRCNILNKTAIEKFADYKSAVLQQCQEIIRHET